MTTKRSSLNVLALSISMCLMSCSSLRPAQDTSIRHLSYAIQRDTIYPDHVTHFILLSHNSVAVSTPSSLYILREDKLVGSFSMKDITCLLVSEDTLYIGGSSGLYTLQLSTLQLVRKPLAAKEKYPKINALAMDQDRTIWIGTESFGLYSLCGDRSRPYSIAPYVSSIALTRDSSIWVGSNVGVFRIFASGEIKRYYEEIPANGIAIPDNMIEHMNVDQAGHLWIFMSQAVSVLTPDDYEKYHTVAGDGDVDPHTFAFLGSSTNHITKFVQHKNKSNAWWAISTEGIFEISDVEFESNPIEPGIPDRIEQPKANLKKITSFQDLRTHQNVIVADPTDLAFDDNGNLWISGKDGLFSIGAEILQSIEGGSNKMQARK